MRKLFRPHLTFLVLLLALPAHRGAAQEKPAKPFVLTSFIAAAPKEWQENQKGFLRQLAFVRAKAKEINPRFAPSELPNPLVAIAPLGDKRKVQRAMGKLVFATGNVHIAGTGDSVIVCKGDLTLTGPVISSLLFVDGNLTLKGRSGISSCCIFVTGSCAADQSPISDSVVFCLGKVSAETIGNSFVVADLSVASLLAQDAQFAGGGVLRTRDEIDVTYPPTGAATEWFRFYTVRDFPLRLKNQKGKFVVEEFNEASPYARHGLRRGDQIVQIADVSQFETRFDILTALKKAAGGSFTLRVLRDDRTLDLTIGK